MEGNASVYQVYPVSRITGERRAAFLRAWGPGFEEEGAPGGGGGTGGATQSVRGNYNSFQGDKSDGLRRNAPVYHVYPVIRTTNSFRSHICTGLLHAWC